MLDELGEACPLSCVHVRMVAIRNVFLVDLVGSNTPGAESSAEQLNKLLLKSGTEFVDDLVSSSRGSKGIHLAEVRFRLEVASISIFVSACFLAELAVEAQLGQSFRLDGIRDRLERSRLGFTHNVLAYGTGAGLR